jgi:putative FmdB family regulatory protein
MPLYDYVCANCGHEVEIMHSVHGDGPTACPVCGGPMKKAIVAPAVHFKGSGWARKERSGSSSRPSRNSSDSDSSSGSGSGSESSGGSSNDSSSSGGGSESKAESADSAGTKKDPD